MTVGEFEEWQGPLAVVSADPDTSTKRLDTREGVLEHTAPLFLLSTRSRRTPAS